MGATDFCFSGMVHPPPTEIVRVQATVVEMACGHGCTPKAVPAGHVVLEQGAMDAPLFLLLDGILGATVKSAKRSMILYAFVEGDAFTCMESFHYGVPGAYGVEALTSARYLEIPRTILARMVAEASEVGSWVSEHHRRWISRMTQRIIELGAASPMHRYLHFARAYPQLFNRLPQYAIASLLGITAESLSRVRQRLSKRKANSESGAS